MVQMKNWGTGRVQSHASDLCGSLDLKPAGQLPYHITGRCTGKRLAGDVVNKPGQRPSRDEWQFLLLPAASGWRILSALLFPPIQKLSPSHKESIWTPGRAVPSPQSPVQDSLLVPFLS